MEKNNIIVGITGGIAAYKAPELVRILMKAGHDVKVAMTESATKFVTPLTFEALSKNQIITGMFEENTVGRKIRVYYDLDIRLMFEDFFAKLSLFSDTNQD